MVNGGLIGGGIVLLVIAVIGYITPVAEGGTIPDLSALCNSGMGQLGQAFSGDVVKACSEYQMMLYGIYGSGLLGIILLIVGAVVSGNKKESTYTREIEDDALDILEKRYAKGEITKKEFDEMKKDLE